MINTKQLRCWIGFLGMMLPWIVLILSIVFGYGFPQSISATYFIEPCVAPFMIILGSASILLCCYKGYDKVDDVLNTVGGILGLCICLFPCSATELPQIGMLHLPAAISNIIHCISAVGFFGILAYNSWFQFTKCEGLPTQNKIARNTIYRMCSIGMIVTFVMLPIMSIFAIPCGVWIVEALALFWFGLAWITKAERFKWLYAD